MPEIAFGDTSAQKHQSSRTQVGTASFFPGVMSSKVISLASMATRGKNMDIAQGADPYA